ncbi:unnamed protein product (macronuclear) [Paramecium tetraurelia]|uniref:Uncharacterized protein n=1 Tax=Paramecium tetraurelia TaxID=5888 RepID=A0BQ15_PARTE|nr:uncharacterized protein GSPATT00005383001 [Paramecium tetraurelia]CAK60632.1 unnamed protein product [Paramecium tetraurelia]|eukprot:XP_001428030.1 hypothetical protein (macronuclear) [Paramecium tetraurelia strain d4-2]
MTFQKAFVIASFKYQSFILIFTSHEYITNFDFLIQPSVVLKDKEYQNGAQAHNQIEKLAYLTKQSYIGSSQLDCPDLIKQEDKLYKITYLKRVAESDQKSRYKCQTLGALLIDKLLKKSQILERKYNNEFFECRLSFLNQKTETQKECYLEYDQIMNFYDQLPLEIITEKNRNQFQNTIKNPYECWNFQFTQGRLVGIIKKMNYDFLRLMGINEEILDVYIQNENQIPMCCDIQQFIRLRDGIYYNSSLINFQGEIFESQIEIKKFLQTNSCVQISNYFIYFIYNCDRSKLNVNKIENNYLTYFQQSTLPLLSQISIHKSRITKPCNIKPIRDFQ